MNEASKLIEKDNPIQKDNMSKLLPSRRYIDNDLDYINKMNNLKNFLS
jgi:hypothetical protein